MIGLEFYGLAMKKIDPHICSCESLLELTYADTFSSLDQLFVNGIAKLVHSERVSLCLGEYNEEGDNRILASYPKSLSETGWSPEVAFPIMLSTGQLTHLLLDIDPPQMTVNQVAQLIAVYVNQYGHLARSNKDRLTGLKNRRSFDIEYLKLTSQAKASESNVIAVLDIDHFKQVNDRYGHIIGDETLIGIANIMKQFFVKDDYLYRFGGEEFVVLLQDMRSVEAEIILEQLRTEVEDHHFPQIGSITISIGFVELSHNCDSALFFERADAALYQAKAKGRNRICNYQTLVDQGDIKPIDKRAGGVELF